jgi:hypothetical protein
MKYVLLRALLIGGFCAAAQADGVTPRYSDAAQPRQAEAVLPRNAPPVQPRQAAAVELRHAPAVQGTAVQGNSSEWRWQNAGDSAVAGDGVARGSQLKEVQCAGVTCRIVESTAGAWEIRAEGGFPEASGRTLDVLVVDAQTRKPATGARNRGVFSDGRFWDQLDTYRLPPGKYAVFYKWHDKNKVLAAITFDVLNHEVAARGKTHSGHAGNDANARQRAKDIALQNQRCLAMAAGNSDIRCVPQ